jgi:hypothetical protein
MTQYIKTNFLFFSLGIFGFLVTFSISSQEIPKQIIANQEANPRPNALSPEFMRSLLLTPEQSVHFANDNSLWFQNYRVGFALRPRFESRTNPDFNKNTNDSTQFTGQNSQFYLIGDPSPYLSFKLTLQDSRIWGGNPSANVGDNRRFAIAQSGQEISQSSPNSTTVRNTTDLREAFLMLKIPDSAFQIQIGRQAPAYGDQRMIGGANWLNNGVSLDGARILYDKKDYSIHFLGYQLTEESNGPNGLLTQSSRKNGSIDDSYFYGNYNTIRTILATIDFYALGLHKKWILNPNPTTTEDRQRQQDILITGGFRLTNRTQSNSLPAGQFWDWTVESAWQRGSTGERVGLNYSPIENGVPIFNVKRIYDTQFHFFQTGITFWDRLRIGTQYSYASGDPNRTDAKSGTFETLIMPRHSVFPNWNNVNGQAEFTSWRNAKAYSLNISYKSEKLGRFILAGWDFYKAKSQDSWYGAGGQVNQGGSSESLNNNYADRGYLGNRLAIEYDFTWIYYFGDYYSIWAGASYLRAQSAIRDKRDDLRATIPSQRYSLEGTSQFYYLMVNAAI